MTGLALLAGCWTPTQAQTSADSTTTPSATKKATRPRYLRLSVGTIPDTYWTYRCLKVGIEYAPMLTKHLGVAGRLVGLAGHPTSSDPAYGPWIDQVPNQNCRAAYAEAEALYRALRRTYQALGYPVLDLPKASVAARVAFVRALVET